MIAFIAGAIVVFFAWLGVGLVAVTLPGIWLAISVAMLVWWWQLEMFSVWTIASCIALGIVGEILEFLASAAGSKRAGGSRAGAWGSLGGTVVGLIAGTILIPIPIVGSVIGGVVGAGLGALFAERGIAGRTWGESYKSGRGAAGGRAFSMVLKTLVAIVVAVVLTVAVFV